MTDARSGLHVDNFYPVVVDALGTFPAMQFPDPLNLVSPHSYLDLFNPCIPLGASQIRFTH